ncbi:hypothetical protein KUCAC02_028324, partial [Chaenocephalus aceratus]
SGSTLTGWERVHLVLRACRIIGNEGLIIACQPAAVITLLPQTRWGPRPAPRYIFHPVIANMIGNTPRERKTKLGKE